MAFWALDTSSLAAALHLSGSSLTTLGFAAADGFWEQLLAFTEAGWGFFTLTLVITYLPTMYNGFSRREAQVGLLEVRAGSPPSATEFVLRHHRIGWLDDLDEYWLTWERWFVELEEAHTSYPALNFLRSPRSERSWITAAGTALDAVALMASTVDRGAPGPQGVSIRAGYIALRRIADFFGIAYDPDPSPTDPISIIRSEFNDAWEQLAASGVPLISDQDQA